MEGTKANLVDIPQDKLNDAVRFAMAETCNMVFADKSNMEILQETKLLFETIYRMGYLAGYHRENGEHILKNISNG
jgi:hypothetical protein